VNADPPPAAVARPLPEPVRQSASGADDIDHNLVRAGEIPLRRLPAGFLSHYPW
jgi:hypothetical protein